MVTIVTVSRSSQSPITLTSFTLTSSTIIQSIHAQLPRRRVKPSRQRCTLVTPPAKGDLIRCLWSSVSWFIGCWMHRAPPAFDELCGLYSRKANIVRIQCIPIASDDGLGGVVMPEGYYWHDRYTHRLTRRIVRVKVVAQVRTKCFHRDSPLRSSSRSQPSFYFGTSLVKSLEPDVVDDILRVKA
jgi:hypothetical protein